MTNNTNREQRRILTTKQRYGSNIFKNAGQKGGKSTWSKIRNGGLINPL